MILLDLFSGIGGFHLGLTQAGIKFDKVYYSEIDKHAVKQYERRFPDAEWLGDITSIRSDRLPKHIDLICGGFPCQSFSIAGKRGSFNDTRGTLFFEIARILRHYIEIGNPIKNFILENVKGLYSAGDHSAFATIHGILTDLDYTIECELLNTRNFSCPQNRERIYIVGHFRGECRPKVFPLGQGYEKVTELQGQYTNTIKARYEATGDGSYIIEGEQHAQEGTGLKQIGTIGEDSEATRVYDTGGNARTIKDGGGMGAKTGLYEVMAYSKSHRTDNVEHRIKTDEFNTLSTGKGCTNQSSANYIKIIGNLKGDGGHECHNVHDPNGIAPTVRNNHGKTTMIENPSLDENGNTTALDANYYKGHGTRGNKMRALATTSSRIRRLTPTECERLQGFPDGWTEGQSDTQRYKQLGNAVSVPVVKAIGEQLYENK